MTKRNNKNERRPRDFYPTPEEAVLPLLPWLETGATFVEPCAGKGDLIEHLEKHGLTCLFATDIGPKSENIGTLDAMELDHEAHPLGDYIITNPPWDRKILHPMIEHFRKLRPTWLLLDSDWMFTKQARPHLVYCSLIVSVGRVKWIPNSPHVGFDNCAWYLFRDIPRTTIFINVNPEGIK